MHARPSKRASPSYMLGAAVRVLCALGKAGVFATALGCAAEVTSDPAASIADDASFDRAFDAATHDPSMGDDVDGAPHDDDDRADASIDRHRADAEIDAETSDAAPADALIATDGAGSDAAARDDGSPVDVSMRCNGNEALCDRRFDEVVFATAHNAMSNADDGWVVPNQQHGMTRQLADGIRGMLIDTHSFMGSSYLCHGSCWLGRKLLVDGLREIAEFVRRRPHEVLMLIVEDHIPLADTEAAFAASGLLDFVHVQPVGDAWPTLRVMIDGGRRVVVGSESAASPPAWYHRFYDLAWDTPYAFKFASDFSCRLHRGNRQNALFLLNHWLENPLPDESLSRTANARDVLLARARRCQVENGKLPNFVAVSHYAVGDLFAVVRELNGL